MSRFHNLKIKDIQPQTRDAVALCFEVPHELKDSFRFRQGQHLVVRANINGEEVRRSYSICSSANDGELRVAVKRVAGGAFSTYANEHLKPGSELEVMPPEGKFYVELNPEHAGRYLAVAAGSGITPLLSIIQTTLETEPNSVFTLLYGNRSTASTMFREELEDLKNRYLERLNLIFVFSREQQDVDLYNGHIDADKCNRLFSQWIDVRNLNAAFICGPQDMTESVRNCLQENGLPPQHIHFELFAAPGSGQHNAARVARAAADTSSSRVSVISDGREISFDLPRNTQSVLDAGNAQGADLPYSCKAGVCSTCKCKVIEGEVEMDANFALEDYEVAAGYVLSCQTFPVSDKVVLDFDQ